MNSSIDIRVPGLGLGLGLGLAGLSNDLDCLPIHFR